MAAELRSWEDVLAAVEADAERTAALLASDVDVPFEPVPLELPPVDVMPALPPHLRDRALVLRDRLAALQVQLSATLREWRVPAMPASVVATAAPRFLDRRV